MAASSLIAQSDTVTFRIHAPGIAHVTVDDVRGDLAWSDDRIAGLLGVFPDTYDLMDVSRIVAGKLRLELRPVELPAIIHTAAEIVRPAASARNVQLHIALDPGAARVQGDPARLQQVVWNLLMNAVKFSAEGGSVEVRLDTSGSEATITIADAGQGIDPELLPHIFERFRQADGSGARRQGGLGLGLSIARDLAQMHGGTLDAASDGIGHGSRFTIRLPLLLPDPVAATVATPHGPLRA